MMSSIGAYLEPVGRVSGALASKWLSILPIMMVVTSTPKGESSRRSVSEKLVSAALEETYVAVYHVSRLHCEGKSTA